MHCLVRFGMEEGSGEELFTLGKFVVFFYLFHDLRLYMRGIIR